MTTVNPLELRSLLQSQPSMVLLNVRPADTDMQDCLPRSLHVPLSDLEARAATLLPDKDASIALYGADLTCEASTKGSLMLEKLGYKNIYNFTAGLKAWKEAGFSH